MNRASSAGTLALFAFSCVAAWTWLLWIGPWSVPWTSYLPLCIAIAAAALADSIRISQRPQSAWTMGLLLFVVGGLALGYAAAVATATHAPFPEANAAWIVARQADPSLDPASFFADRKSPVRSHVPLANTLWALTLFSGLLFFALLILKPHRTPTRPTSQKQNLWEPWR